MFELDTRDMLLRERAHVIATMHAAEAAQRTRRAAVKRSAQLLLALAVDPGSPHANCARHFARLLDLDRDKADEIADQARQHVGVMA